MIAVADQFVGENKRIRHEGGIGMKDCGDETTAGGVGEDARGFVRPGGTNTLSTGDAWAAELRVSPNVAVAHARIEPHQGSVLVTIVKGPFFVSGLCRVGTTQRIHIVIDTDEIRPKRGCQSEGDNEEGRI